MDSAPAYHVTLAVSPDALGNLLGGDTSLAADRVRLVAQNSRFSEISLPLSPGARFAAESIRRCPFAGASRELALTARGLDMLAEFIAALNTAAKLPDPGSHLPLHDTLAQVRAAADALKSRMENPPSIAELAELVGLSESTLKRGFRQLYHTTPFGHLRTLRMDRARQLLEQGESTVLEAAAFVGYNNPSNFAAAFRNRFGVNPKTFQMAARR